MEDVIDSAEAVCRVFDKHMQAGDEPDFAVQSEMAVDGLAGHVAGHFASARKTVLVMVKDRHSESRIQAVLSEAYPGIDVSSRSLGLPGISLLRWKNAERGMQGAVPAYFDLVVFDDFSEDDRDRAIEAAAYLSDIIPAVDVRGPGRESLLADAEVTITIDGSGAVDEVASPLPMPVA